MVTHNFYSILIIGILIQLCSSITLDEFYPYGLKNGHQALVRNDDGNSNEIAITTTFPFCDKQFNSLYVNTNGMISFDRAVSQYTPARFPLGDGRVMIAPFWADVDISRRGNVWYAAVTDKETLKRATKDVRESFPSFKQFSATWTFVTTWYKVPYFGSNNMHDRTNTFQSIIITNGRYSFVRFNYNEITWTSGTASGGNSSGLGGVLPECGFNSGDGNYSYSITQPGNIGVLDLPHTTNVKKAKAGVWMFRIDKAEIEDGGCSKSGFLTFLPSDYEVVMFGGRNLNVFGPCFQKTDTILCKFADGTTSPGVYMSRIKVRCTPPMVNFIGKATLSLSRDNGKTFPYHGIFFYVSQEELEMKKTKLQTLWMNTNTLNIRWSSSALTPSYEGVRLQIARFVLKNDAVKFHSFYDISDNNRKKEATGTSLPSLSENVVLYEKEVDGKGERFASFLRVIKRVLHKTQAESSHEWLWSKALKWPHTSEKGSHYCKDWAAKQPDPEILKDNQLLACPPSKEKVDEDDGRYRKTNDPLPLFGMAIEEKHCYITITPSLKNFGQRCCYNKEGNLLVGYEDNGGSLQRVHHEADYPYVTHYFQDVLPYYDCCHWSKRLCKTYYKKRPSDDGTKYTPPRPAATFGEPHIITLDGVQYTFNGYGEYIVLKISNDKFMLQGRMEQLKPINGTSINGTVYTAFAMKSFESDAVQIALTDLGDIEVTVNQEERQFDSDGIILFFNGAVKRKPNTSKYSVTFRNGVRVTVEKETQLLQLMVKLPDKFLGKTSGLLGFFDDNKEKEFLLPNGTFLKTSSDAKTLHYNFGLKWAVDVNESLFNYYGDRNHSYFHKDNFVPMFFDYDNLTFNDANLEREARRVCQGDVQCLVDAIATGQPSFGMFSRNITNEYKRTLKLTMKKDCTPLSPNFDNGLMLRNDSKEGEIQYTFKCNANIVLNGSSVISCKNGIWNGTKPSCKGVKKVKIEENDAMKLIKVIAISTSCGAVFIAVVVGTLCYMLKKSQRRIVERTQKKEEIGEENRGQAMSSLDLSKSGYPGNPKAAWKA